MDDPTASTPLGGAPSEDLVLDVVLQAFLAIHDVSVKEMHCRTLNIDKMKQVRMFEDAWRYTPEKLERDVRRLFVDFVSASVNITNTDFAVAWKNLNPESRSGLMGDVTNNDENKLADNAEFHIWKAVSNDDQDSLSVNENLAFARLKDSLAVEASRPVLRSMIAYCLVPEVIRRPEGALGLVTTLGNFGLHYDELQSGLSAARCEGPWALSVMAGIGRRWGAYEDIFAVCSTRCMGTLRR